MNLDDLNAPQREAVTHAAGPLLIFAGAGSGKTRTLTYRIAHLIQEHKVPASRILSVTFTNKAAREMRERLETLVGHEARRIWMGTFHAMCARMLRMHGEHIGVDPRFVIFDADDSLRLMKDVVREADVDSDRYVPARILNRISAAKNDLRSPDDLQSSAASPYDRIIARLYTQYQERLKAAHALDFDDILGEAVRLLKESPESRNYYSERFLHILIDEFQDVNLAQFQWVQMLAEKHRNICVVGDDDQSIYAWRGANVQLILDFEKQYSDTKIIRLEQNYRSTQKILDAAHGVISQNFGRKPKKLWTQAESGNALTLHGAMNAQEEALWIVRQIEMAGRSDNRRLSEFAILCRINAQSRPFEEAFMRARMPLRLVGTQRFYERKEIKDLVGYLKVLYNRNDDIALARIINVPARGIGARTIEKLQMLANENGCSLWDVLMNPSIEAALGRAVAAKIEPLRVLLETLQRDAQNSESIAELLDAVIRRTHYLEYLEAEKSSSSVDRAANVDQLLASAEEFEMRMDAEDELRRELEEDQEYSDAGYADEISRLGMFLETAALEDRSDTNNATGAEEDNDAVTLMTLHAAKGLEFPVVFLAGMEQGLLPHARAIYGERAGPDDLEEERRLCYVGLTRAQEEIYLTYAAQRTLHGRTESTQPSQFLEEMPEHLLERSGLAKTGSMSSWSTASWGSTPARSSTPAPTEPTYKIGDRVRHETYGEGLVANVRHAGRAGEMVEIAFFAEEVGKKTLAVAYAPLSKIEV